MLPLSRFSPERREITRPLRHGRYQLRILYLPATMNRKMDLLEAQVARWLRVHAPKKITRVSDHLGEMRLQQPMAPVE